MLCGGGIGRRMWAEMLRFVLEGTNTGRQRSCKVQILTHIIKEWSGNTSIIIVQICISNNFRWVITKRQTLVYKDSNMSIWKPDWKLVMVDISCNLNWFVLKLWQCKCVMDAYVTQETTFHKVHKTMDMWTATKDAGRYGIVGIVVLVIEGEYTHKQE